MGDVYMESPAPTPSSRPLAAEGDAVASTSAAHNVEMQSQSPKEESGGGGGGGGGFNYFDALDVELERRILRQLSHEVSQGNTDNLSLHLLVLPILAPTPPSFLFGGASYVNCRNWRKERFGFFSSPNNSIIRSPRARVTTTHGKQDLANLAQTCRRFAALTRDDDVLWKEACRHRFDDSWLGRREWATSELADPKKPWRSRYRQTITTLRRWRTGKCTHRRVDVREASKHHEGIHPCDILAIDISGDVLATGDVNGLVCIWSLADDDDGAGREAGVGQGEGEGEEAGVVGVDRDNSKRKNTGTGTGTSARGTGPIRHRYTLRGHTNMVITIVLHCDCWNERNGRVLTASEDGTARIFDTETQRCLHVLRHDEVPCNIHPIHEPVYHHGAVGADGFKQRGDGGRGGEQNLLDVWGGVNGGGGGGGEANGGRCGVGYDDANRTGTGGGGRGSGGAADGRGEGSGVGGGAPRWRSWNQMLAAHAARDEGQPAFEFAFHRVIVKCAPQTEWPAETNVETHWSWDLRTETLERTFEPCCLSDLVIDDRVLAMLVATGDHRRQHQHQQHTAGGGAAVDENEGGPSREFSVVLRDIDTGETVVEQALPPFPRSYGGVTKFSVCNTPRPGATTKVWHGLIEFADERHIAEFGCSADGVPFSHVHCLSPHARFCSLGCPNYSFPIGSAQDGDKLYLVARDVVPGSVTDNPHFKGRVALRAFCLEGKNKGELKRIGGSEPLEMPYDSDGTVNLVAAQVPDPALVSTLSLVMVGEDGGLRVWTLPDGQVSEQLPVQLKLSLTAADVSSAILNFFGNHLSGNVDNAAAQGAGGGVQGAGGGGGAQADVEEAGGEAGEVGDGGGGFQPGQQYPQGSALQTFFQAAEALISQQPGVMQHLPEQVQNILQVLHPPPAQQPLVQDGQQHPTAEESEEEEEEQLLPPPLSQAQPPAVTAAAPPPLPPPPGGNNFWPHEMHSIEVVNCHSSWRWLIAIDYEGIQVFDFVERGAAPGGGSSPVIVEEGSSGAARDSFASPPPTP